APLFATGRRRVTGAPRHDTMGSARRPRPEGPTMRAVLETTPGGPAVLAVTDVPAPELTPDGVRIRVRAAGINRADVMQRRGKYPVPPGASSIFGLEVSGTVQELGPEVPACTGLAPGDEVVALLDSG